MLFLYLCTFLFIVIFELFRSALSMYICLWFALDSVVILDVEEFDYETDLKYGGLDQCG